MNFLSIIIPTLISVFLILYFRRKDKRNTQLQTLKTFINTSVQNMSGFFQQKEKEILDKTINLDISLKKLDKASAFINNKLVEIKDQFDTMQELRQNLITDLKAAASFDKGVHDIGTKLAELSRAAGEIEELRKDIQDTKKTSSQIKNELEQSRVWAQDTITEFMHKTQDDISEYKATTLGDIDQIKLDMTSKAEEAENLASQIEESLTDAQKRLEEIRHEMAAQLDDKDRDIDAAIEEASKGLQARYDELTAKMGAGVEAKLKAHKQELESADKALKEEVQKAKNDFLGSAQNLKQSIGTSLNEFTSRWNEAIRKFNEMNKEVVSKTTSLEEHLKSTEKTIGKRLGDLESTATDKIGNFEIQMGQILQQKGNKFDSEFNKIENGFKSKVDGISAKIEKNLEAAEEDLKQKLTKEMSQIIAEVTSVTKEFQGKKTDIENKIGELTSSIDSQFKRLESDYRQKIIEIDQKFGKINTDMISIEKRIQNEAEQLFTRANTEISKEIDNLKKNVETNASERLQRIDEKITSDVKKFEDEFNSSLKAMNSKLGANSNTINEMNGKLAKFIKDATDKFKGEIAALKTSSVGEVNQFLEEIAGKEKNLNSLAEHLQKDVTRVAKEIQEAGKNATENSLQKLKERENEIYTSIEKSSGLISDRLGQIEKTIDNFEVEVGKKVQSVHQEIQGELNDYRKYIDDLKSSGMKIEANIEDIISNRTKEIDGYLENLKQGFVDDYKQLINNTKDEIVQLKDTIEEIQGTIKTQRKDTLNETSESFKQIKTWALSQTAEVKDEIESTRIRTEGILADVRDDVEKKIAEYNQILEDKIAGALKESDADIGSKKKELLSMTAELIKQANEKERDLGKKIERMNKIVDDAMEKTGKDLTGLKNEFEKRFGETIKNIENKGDASIDSLKQELNAMLEDYNKLIETGKEDVFSLRDENAALKKEISTQKKTFVADITATLKEAKDWTLTEIQGIKNEIGGIGESSETVMKELKGDIDKKIVEFEKEFTSKIAAIMKDADTDIAYKKDDIQNITNDLIKQVNEKEKDLTKRVEKINRSVDDSLEKTAKDLSLLKVEFEKRFDAAIQEIEDKGEAGIKGLTAELNGMMDSYNKMIEDGKDDVEKLRDATAAIKKEVLSHKNTIISDITAALKEARETSLAEIQGIRKEMESVRSNSEEVLDDVKNTIEKRVAEFDREYNAKIAAVIKEADKDVADKKDDIQNITGELLKQVGDKEKELSQKIGKMNSIIDEAIEKADGEILSIQKNLEEKFENTYQELSEKGELSIENVKSEIKALVDKLKSETTQSIQETRSKVEEMGSQLGGYTTQIHNIQKSIKGFDKVLDDLKAEAIEEYKQGFARDLEAFKDSFLPPTEEIVNRLSDKAEDIKGEFEARAGEFSKSVESFASKIKANEDKLSERLENIIAQYNSRIEEYKQDFSEKVGKTIESSDNEFKKIHSRMLEMDKDLKGFQEKTVDTIRDKALALENDMTKKLNTLAGSLENYLKKSDQDFKASVDGTKQDINKMLLELKNSKNSAKEEIIEDIKELNKRTKEIEARYDSLLKKSSVLERAEGLADKSNRTIEVLSAYLKDMDLRRKEIEDALKNIEIIRIEHKEINSVLANIGGSKKEATAIHQAVTEALQKAKDTQELLSIIEKQAAKADDIKGALLETLKLYEDVRLKITDLESKRDIVNQIFGSIETAKEDVDGVEDRVAQVDERIMSINKLAKKIDDELKTAQSNINRLFSDQDKMSIAVDKIVDIDNLLMHIEEESKKVQKMRDWVAKLETQLERIKETQEGNISGTGKHSKKGASKAVEPESTGEEDVIKNILRLKEQGWSIEEISKSLKISRAYVELIIERYEE